MKKVIITAGNVSSIDSGAKSKLKDAGLLVEEYPETEKLSVKERLQILQDADAVIAGLEVYDKGLLEQLPTLKLIARRGVGVDNIDLDAAKELGITVTITDGLVGSTVAELILAYLLEHSRKLSLHNLDMKQGIWSRRLSEGLRGKYLGLVGFGSIAKETAIRANSFGMKVLCYYRHRDPAMEQAYQVEYCDFNTLITISDYISVNVPLTKETTHLFTREAFQRMKSSAVLINTARSAIVHTGDLIEALHTGTIAGAYLDVYDAEPCNDPELLSCTNAFFTPHVGTFTKETFIAMNNRCAEQVLQFFHPSVD